MKLIKLQDKFILVNDGEEGINPEVKYFDDKVDSDNIYIGTEMFTENKIYYYVKGVSSDNRIVHKIIAGIPELPTIDFSLLSEEDCKTIGFVNVERLAREEILYNDSKRDWWKQGFKTSQSLNDKMFSLEDMEQCFLSAREFNSMDGVVDINVVLNFTNDNSDLRAVHVTFEDYIQSLQQTNWNVEVEMYACTEDYGMCAEKCKGTCKPRITNNSIKVLKII